MNTPRVIVLILSYNGISLLDDSISTYLGNDYDNFEVVVVDNGSIDGTKQFVESNYPQAKVVRTEHNLGYSGGLNFGMRYAFDEQQADYVLITNNDVGVDSHVISELVKVAEANENVGFVTGKVYYYDHPEVLQTTGRRSDPIRWSAGAIGRNEVDTGQYDEICEREFCDDIYWLVNKKLYDVTGGYDETFYLQAEDYDWQARAKKNGFRIFYTPHARLWHKVSMTIGKQSALKAFYDSRNPMLVILLHKSPEFFQRYFRYYLKNNICKSSLKNMGKLRFDVAWNQWAGMFSALKWGFQNRKFTWRHFLK